MKRRRSRKNQVRIPVASMGDIAFLLLIFFVLCSNFAQNVAVQLKPPRAAGIEELQQTSIAVAISDDGTIFLRNSKVPDAEAVEWGVASLLKDKKSPAERVVMFKCDQGISREQFEPVLEAIAKGGGLIAAVGEVRPPGR